MSRKPILGVLPAFDAIQLPNGRLVLLGRFLSGMAAYREHWDGDLRAIIEPAPPSSLETNLDRTLGGDNVEVDPKDLDFEVELVDYRDPRLKSVLAGCDVALAAVFYRQNHLVDLAKEVDVPIIYNSEYTLRTRIQIHQAEQTNPLIVARRVAWEINQERLHRRAIRMSDGLQANGVPTYEAYRRISPSPMLFFDGRMSEDIMVPEDVLETRLRRMLEGGPLRMTWSGRLNKMKGADQLVEVGRHLAELGVDFQLDIYGGGLLEKPMKAAIEAHGLGDRVHMRGYVDFDELIPRTQREYDLWLCCHPQGDPSGAYLETLGNGLPIVGYDNEALAGVLARVDAGKVAPIYAAQTLAAQIAELDQHRRQLADWARTGLSFARNHTLGRSFRRRVEHFEEVLAKSRQSPRDDFGAYTQKPRTERTSS